MKKILKYLSFIICLCLIIPTSSAYEFESTEREEKVKGTRREIYDLYNLYKEIVRTPQSSSSSSIFGVIGYNGVCSNVTVDGTTIPLEDYVAGVVKAEMGAESDNPEMMKSQAIAARSFLLASKKKASNCTVDNGQNYQAYRKVDANNATDKRFIEAANATAGQVVSRNGEPALTQYLSYPNEVYCTEDSSGWHVKLQKFYDDPSTVWTWNGPAKATVLAGNNWAPKSGVATTGHFYGMSQTIAGYLTRVEGYTYEQIIDLFYGQTIQTITDGNYAGNVSYVNSGFGSVVYFNQGDYSNYYYSENPTSSNKYGGTIQSHGCGPTAASIVASSILNRNIDPVTMTRQVCLRGGCTVSGTINDTLGTTLSGDYGLNVKMSGNDQDVINALGTGNALVIVLMGPGTFTTGGHFIVLTGVNANGQVSVADPGSRARTDQKWFSFNTIVEQRKKYANYTIVTR